MSQIALEFGRERGGRVFIDNQRYYFVDRSPRVRTLCDLTWPKSIEVVEEVKTIVVKVAAFPYDDSTASLNNWNEGDVKKVKGWFSCAANN